MQLFRSILKSSAITITHVLPQSKWYRAAYMASGVLAKASDLVVTISGIPTFTREQKKYKNTVAINHAIKLNYFLAVMTHGGKPFPIPILAQGIEVLRKPRPKGVILCSTHIPLVKVALRHLMEHNFKPTLALAADPGVINSISVWGVTEKVAAARTGPYVLQKAKTVLQDGGSIVVLVDKVLGGEYSPNIFRLAEKINADVVFFDAALQDDGIIKVRFHESEWNGYKQENCTQKQLNELYQHTEKLLQQYNNSGYLTAPC
ncbi:hypothetical protein GCM10028818_40780 [Spirosoma horti]